MRGFPRRPSPSIRSIMKLALLTFALALPALAQDVHRVEKDGSGDFPDVQSAVAAAADGDIVLVGAGGYAAPALVDRALTIVAAEGDQPALGGRLEILGAADEKTTLVSGFAVNGSFAEAATVRDCKGAVRFAGCTFQGESPEFCSAPPAVLVRRSRDVAFLACELQGGDSGVDYGCDGYPRGGGDGLEVRRSRVSAWRSVFRGGDGSNAVLPDFTNDGGAGARVVTGKLYAFYDVFHGGRGGDDLTTGAVGCGRGGDALICTGSVVDQSAILLPGAGGSDVDQGTSCDDGLPFAGSGKTDLPGVPRGLEGPRVVTEGESFTLTVFGVSGDRAYIALSSKTRFRYEPDWEGGRLVGLLDLPWIPLATLDGSGTATGTFRAPPLPPGAEGGVYWLQVAVQDAAGDVRLGSPVALVVLAPGV